MCERGVDDRGVFVQHYDTEALDASLLLIPLMGFLPPDDERVRKTVLAIADELTQDGLVLRYRVEHTDDGLEGEEGTFTICSFWLVTALAQIGEAERARALCEKLLSFASPLLLYAEEIDAASGRHLGNFPQAFTHLSLINALMSVIEAEAQGIRMSSMVARGGIDLGGTKIQAVVVDGRWNVLGQSRRPTPTEGGPGDVAEQMAEALREAALEAGIRPERARRRRASGRPGT